MPTLEPVRFFFADGAPLVADIRQIAGAMSAKLAGLPVSALHPQAIAGHALRLGLRQLWRELELPGDPASAVDLPPEVPREP